MRRNLIFKQRPKNSRWCVSLLWVLLLLFVIRVAGQMLQHWAPVSFLPPESAFQGSHFPYWLLLSIQLLIFVMMTRVAWHAHSGKLEPSAKTTAVLGWLGGIYMFGSLARLVVGLGFPDSHVWFRTWIPAVSHVVLAGFVLTLYFYHRHFLYDALGKK